MEKPQTARTLTTKYFFDVQNNATVPRKTTHPLLPPKSLLIIDTIISKSAVESLALAFASALYLLTII